MKGYPKVRIIILLSDFKFYFVNFIYIINEIIFLVLEEELIKSIVLVSGGLDSLVTAGIASKESDELFFLHCNYGQRTEKKEKESFVKIVEFFQPKDTLNANIDYLAKIGGSSLTDNKIDVKNFDNSNEVPDSYVPFRNAHLVAIAVSWAEVIGANRIYIGAVEEDSSGYPDCREDFYKSLNKTVNLGTKDETVIEIRTPIIHKRKSETIKIGSDFGIPLDLSWSCYQNNEVACGTCDSCHLRIQSFKEAGLQDPIPYEIDIDWDNK